LAKHETTVIPTALLSIFGLCRLFFVPEVESHSERSLISDNRRDRRKFAMGPTRYPAKHVSGCVPELEINVGSSV
jgi:hypothetical protein